MSLKTSYRLDRRRAHIRQYILLVSLYDLVSIHHATETLTRERVPSCREKKLAVLGPSRFQQPKLSLGTI
jgi:hypothetical protein